MDRRSATTGGRGNVAAVYYRLRYFLHPTSCPLHTNSTSGCGKERRIKNRSMVKPEKAAPVNRSTLKITGPLPMDSR